MITHHHQGYVQTETHRGITTITFHHPQSNSLPARMLQELTKAIHGAGNEDDCRVIVLRSEGEKAFCAGASFEELLDIQKEQEGYRFFSGFAHVLNAMRKCPKFIIGRIHARCVGGGVGLAAGCDYAIAAPGADVKLSELAVGIGPFVVGPAVERKVGMAGFSSLAIDATMWRNAEWCKRKGLYSELHPSQQDADESIFRLSSQLAASNPQAMAELKKVLWKGTEHWDELLAERAAISGRLVLSHFTRQAIDKFRQSRKPVA
ncbi:MAG TPA: enoyl-CoA hydratase/isomerase family protein [Phnomibacter sp.]|nr:enoyl-CoA hydratase/isomerase family protein [Phnomibacter sp.]